MSHRVLVIGATGGTGREVVTQALEAGHAVTALVRTPAHLTLVHERLRTVTASLPEDSAALGRAMPGHDVVVSALGRGGSLKADGLIARGVPVILEAMHAAGVRRLIFTSAIGVGAAYAEAPIVPRLMIRLLLRDLYADKAIGEASIVQSDLEWTIVQPARLTDGPLTGRYCAGERLQSTGSPSVSRSDVAHFIVGEIAAARYIRKFARLAN